MQEFHKKLLDLIGHKSVNEWSREHNLPPQTVHGWIKDKRVPRGANLKLLVQATGKSAEWWSGEFDASAAYTTTEPVKPLVTSTGVHSGHVANQYMMINKTQERAGTDSVNNWLLSNCFKACLTFYGAEFNALDVLDRMGYATNFYNKIHLLADVLNVPRDKLDDLTEDALIDHIKVLVALKVMPGQIIPTADLYSF